MWRNLLVLTAAAGLSIVVAGNADAQRGGMGMGHGGMGMGASGGASVHSNVGAGVRTGTTIHSRTSLGARAQARGPGFRPPGWSHGRKTGWHCRVGASTCTPPGLRR
jgi:hypothetical protein